ncbi:MAG: aconitate hydratase AcnA [Candidatus Poseidoniales archaeon]|nr:aconitate hydratase AcnA [Candidatus Poseidoniales archaeon]MEC8938606.1 aconitate hydratase AcnA [Candidatus Thermoplasmatota archaeon]MED6312822.1 aconitate hydratase AcnA [Candidatus Thermoplasmatota archaeon]|tara:strand:+ start:4301 stop:6985 length:2685 start_codon:yes stop_codon:yes gene_type:complete
MGDGDGFDSIRSFIKSDGSEADYHALSHLQELGLCDLNSLPFTIRLLLEAALRKCDGFLVSRKDVERIASWTPTMTPEEIPFSPSRVILQDFTGVPAVVDIAALRDAMVELGGDPNRVNPQVPVDLVIDHSVQVDVSGLFPDARERNLEIEYQRNMERYQFLKWGQQSLDNFRAVPPGRGIVHQVNLEWIASVAREDEGVWLPDTLVGTDSHTTMINGLGVLGWGVGGIEAEAVMLGQPIYMLLPEVCGFELTGSLRPGVTATDMTLRIVQMLREHGVVGKFVEFHGSGLANLSLPDRATIANMAPEYGATCGFFPVDETTLDYMRLSGREESHIEDVKRYLSAQGMFHTSQTPTPAFTSSLSLDLSTVEPALAGPKRPQDRVDLSAMKEHWIASLNAPVGHSGHGIDASRNDASAEVGSRGIDLKHGDIVIAAITSCTNTSNPSVMIAAGLLARKARQAGLSIAPSVKPSLAPGSRVVTEYFDAAGLTVDLDALGFSVVGYGCTTCIGNSGPLDADIDAAIDEADLIVGSVLSGNRNFEGRIHQKVKANYLASPPLVVAYAIAGTLGINFETDPIGHGQDGPVMLADIWPSDEEIKQTIASSIDPEMFRKRYADVLQEPRWDAISTSQSAQYPWADDSTYVRLPSFFEGIQPQPTPIEPIHGAKVLLKLGDSVTTDHISPAGAFPHHGPAGQYLISKGVEPRDFNSFGSRRGNHEVMMRGTFANVRIRNQIASGTEGGFTTHFPTNEVVSVFDASMRYQAEGTPLVVLAGTEYGTGSSRDWAAKGTLLLGIKAVIATSFERIHRSNLVGMGVLALTFPEGEDADSLGLDGTETFDIPASADLVPLSSITVTATKESGEVIQFDAVVRLDTPVEVDYYRNGGILQTVLRNLAKA